MKINNQNSISSITATGRVTDFIAVAIISVIAVFFSSANAQNIGEFAAPRLACQSYYNQPGFTIIRDLEHDCLVRNGDSPQFFLYTHYYDSGNNFCLEITGPQGRIFGPQCVLISQTGRDQQQQQQEQQRGTTPKIVTPPSFHIKELQYDTLPTGTPIQAGDNERIEIEMPDGSLIQLDANATFTPVSDHEVQSVFGRYRYVWQPFHDGKCIVGQNLVRQACRKVTTRDAILGVRGTEFLVETDETGTLVMVLEGLLGVADLNGKKTVEVAGGQSTFIKHGGLPEDPQSFDPAKIERWWEKKTADQIFLAFAKIMGGFMVFIVILSIIKKIFGKKKPIIATAPVAVYCVSCGTKILEGASFCTGCGKPLGNIPVGAPVTKKKGSSLLVRIILLIVFLPLIFMLWTFFNISK